MPRFYKHLSLVAIGFLIATSDILSQSYAITPGDSIVADAPFDDLVHYNILQQNISSETLLFSWEQISLSVPIGWQAYLCDNGQCYLNFPMSGTMDSVYATEYGLMSVGINPYNIEGTGVIRYTVWEVSSPSHKDTLTWTISSNGATNLSIVNNQSTYKISPNPANDKINIVSGLQLDFQYIIYDVLGKKVLSGISDKNSISISTENLKNSNYQIYIQDEKNRGVNKTIIVQH